LGIWLDLTNFASHRDQDSLITRRILG